MLIPLRSRNLQRSIFILGDVISAWYGDPHAEFGASRGRDVSVQVRDMFAKSQGAGRVHVGHDLNSCLGGDPAVGVQNW